MGNAESSSSGANEQEKEEKSRGISLSDVGKAAAVTAAGIAALAVGAHRIRSSLPPQREEEGLKSPGFIIEDDSNVHWEPPPRGWLKINTDFSAKTGVGYVIRDHCGIINAAEAMILSEPTSDSTRGEANAIYETLVVAARRLGLRARSLILESDNESIVKLLNKDASPGSRMRAVVQDIIDVMALFAEFEVRHAKRGANRVANHLATEAAKGRTWRSDSGLPSPVGLPKLLNEDCDAAGFASPY